MDLHKTHIVESSAKTVGRCIFALGWLILGTNCAENRERSLHIAAQETIKLNVGERRIQVLLESNAHPDFEGNIWLKKVRIRFV